MTNVVLRNGKQTATFAEFEGGYRPEWFRSGDRPMLRFKDHDWLNVSTVRATTGRLKSESDTHAEFTGTVEIVGEPVDWSVTVTVPSDGHGGFLITSHMAPRNEPIEVLEALPTFELPYEYDGSEESMTVMAQQPVYRFRGDEMLDGPGYNHPNWYYARPGATHLTFPCSSPLFAHRVIGANGENERCTVIVANWDRCSFHDMFAEPSRAMRDNETVLFPDRHIKTGPGLRGAKYLIGSANWNISLYKDPNWLVEPGAGVSQEVIVDYRDTLEGGRWDKFLAEGWERLAAFHYPADGRVEALDIAKAQGASWNEAADWLATQFTRPEGKFGLFNPDRGPYVYAPGTRPKGDNGVEGFAGQWTGPLALLGKLWGEPNYVEAANRLESVFMRDKEQTYESVWTIGPTPMFAGVLRKAAIMGITEAASQRVEKYVRGRADYLLNPRPGARTGDGGIFSWDAYANLIAADLFNRDFHEKAARGLLDVVNKKLTGKFWSFNCAAEGDLVGAGQARPFGHAMAAAANAMAYKRFGDSAYLDAAEQFGNLLLSMHYITYNNSESPDLDTRGWANGSTGGRDQLCHLPPWETGMAIQQVCHLIDIGKARPGHYDVLWMFSKTGLAQFPKARSLKRLYTPDMKAVYRPIDSLPTERAYYRELPYVAYEEPWDQTMLASYQGVEPIVEALMFGGGMVAADDDRIVAIVPGAATYEADLAKTFKVQLWNPTKSAIDTALTVTTATRRGLSWSYTGPVSGHGSAAGAKTDVMSVPPRQVLELQFTIG